MLPPVAVLGNDWKNFSIYFILTNNRCQMPGVGAAQHTCETHNFHESFSDRSALNLNNSSFHL